MATHTFSCIDGHTCGNPVRLVAGGGPRLEGADMLERRAHFLREFDWIRTGLMFEPRGHDMMSGSILYPPTREDCDVGVLFIETSGCLPMCGHGTIGTVTIALENGLILAAIGVAQHWQAVAEGAGRFRRIVDAERFGLVMGMCKRVRAGRMRVFASVARLVFPDPLRQSVNRADLAFPGFILPQVNVLIPIIWIHIRYPSSSCVLVCGQYAPALSKARCIPRFSDRGQNAVQTTTPMSPWRAYRLPAASSLVCSKASRLR